MKIKPEHLEHIRVAFERKQMALQYAHRSFPELGEHIRAAFERKQMALQYAHRSFPELGEYIKAGMSAKRWRWDVATFVGLMPWLCEHVYTYANDAHIDTALRTITGTK